MDMKLNMIFSILSGILIWAVIIWVIVTIKKNQRWKESHPSNDTEKAFVADVIAAIRREAPDFDVAYIGNRDDSIYRGTRYPSGDYGLYFFSLSGKKFCYNFIDHGYIVSPRMAHILGLEIAKQFGGDCRRLYDYEDRPLDNAFSIIGPQRFSAEQRKAQQEKQRFDNATRI